MNHKIILARHGETFSNRNGFIMGRSDSPLTPGGIHTAEELARLLDAEPIAKVFTSPLGRAVASARIYTAGLGLELEIREAMAELSCGEWEGRARHEVSGQGSVLRPTWWHRPPGGESYEDGERRVQEFVKELRQRPTEETALVVGHASVNRVFLKLWLNLGTDVASRIVSPHDTIYLLDRASVLATRSTTGRESKGLLLEPESLPGS